MHAKSMMMALGLLCCGLVTALAPAQPLPGTAALTGDADLAAEMVAGIDRYLMRRIETAPERREKHWGSDYSSRQAYEKSIAKRRERFRTIIGAIDPRVPAPRLLMKVSHGGSSLVARLGGEGQREVAVHAVRWPVFSGDVPVAVYGEGLLLEPAGEALANVVVLPDADVPPEMIAGLQPGLDARSQLAQRLALAGCRVLVPVLIDRKDTWSGLEGYRATNQPHREFIYRMAYEMGRHIIGYEVQKVLAAVDWFAATQPGAPIGVAGYGEGGLLAFYSAALDTRIDAALVSGYFGPLDGLWRHPIYRNVWSLVEEFGQQGVASLIAPRALIIEAARTPQIEGPPPATDDRKGAAPGVIRTPTLAEVRAEFDRSRVAFDKLGVRARIQLVASGEGDGVPGTDAALGAFLGGLGIEGGAPAAPPTYLAGPFEVAQAERMSRQFQELVAHTQRTLRGVDAARQQFWAKADSSSAAAWDGSTAWYRDHLWSEVIGRLPNPSEPMEARSRQIFDEPKWTGYEVVLPVWPDVFAEGILLVPKGIQPGERRPVVVCQHGLESRAIEVVDPRLDSHYYHGYGARLADLGFIVFAPQNPYIGRDEFRVLQRKANPVKASLFSVILGQHQRLLEWLGSLPYVDASRIGFYGLSYGGKTAMRVPPLLDGYVLSICSADFNEWIWKNTRTDSRYSYLFTGEYEMFEFNLGNTFNYAELASLIAPRPFMVERGHHDGVAPDEWVAYEYAKVRRFYVGLGLAERTAIEFFDGPHTIHGVGTFEFLQRHLRWPERDR
ncbi:MAG: dienelactone hydrolase family protein [Bryobacterales bacterium]